MYSGGLVTVGQGDACWLGVGTVAGPAPNQVALFLVIAALAKFAVERTRFDRALRLIGMNPAATSVAGLIHEGRHAVISDEPYPLEDLLAAARPLTAQPMAEGLSPKDYMRGFLDPFGTDTGRAILWQDQSGARLPVSDGFSGVCPACGGSASAGAGCSRH